MATAKAPANVQHAVPFFRVRDIRRSLRFESPTDIAEEMVYSEDS